MIQIDLLIISLFLLITLIIGIYYGRGVKTFQEYAVGSRKISTTVLVLSLIATIYGGGNLSTRLDVSYRKGLCALLLDLTAPMNLYISMRFIIVRMKEFIGHYSIAESMGSIYGKWVRMATALFGIIMCIGFFAIQVKVGLTIITTLFPEMKDLSTHATLFTTLLIIGYATFGGAKSVALTDVYQFLLFGLCFPILVFIFLYHAKNPIDGWHKLMKLPQFNPTKISQWNDMLKGILACFIWRPLLLSLDPARIQRFYMASSTQQAERIFSRTAIIRTIIPLLFLIVAIALHVGGHEIPKSQNVLYYIIELTYFPGIRGMLVTVIFALLMSTADSYLHAASVLFTGDLWPVLTSTVNHVSKPTLRVVRIVSVCMGMLGFWIAYYATHISQIFNKLVNPYLPIVTMPFIMTVLGFRPRAAALLGSMGINSSILLYRIYYKGESLSEKQLFILFMLSALMLLTFHYLLPKRPHTGWVGIPDSSAWDLQNQIT
ncbi:MAG: sodium:solute symporter family protein, partial [Candidatus Cardinium sp.]|nr:sodium:solute symporter family protein [Candidatus Cardinium sp.]